MAENTRKHPPLYLDFEVAIFSPFLQENTFKIHVTIEVLNGVESREACSKQREMAKERDGRLRELF